MAEAVTVLPVPTFLLSKVGVPLTVRTSPETRSSVYVTVADVVRSYVLLLAEMVTVKLRVVMFAVAVAVVFWV